MQNTKILQNKSRNNHVDALKGAAIFFVVLGHLLESGISDRFNAYLYAMIYSFHMPLFVFLAGLFAKETLSERDGDNIVKRIVLPLIAFQIAYTLYVQFVPGWTYGPLQPYWLLWFLVSLLLWRIIMPVFRSPIGLIVSFCLAIAAGYYPQIGYDFSISRTVYFLPFFIIGSLYGFKLLKIIKNHRQWAWGWFILAMVATVTWTYYGLSPINFRGSEPYESYRALTNEPEIGRILLQLLALIGLIGFCALIPQRSKLLEHLGRNVFAIYLFHGFVVMAYKNYIAAKIPLGATGLPILLLIALIICITLAPLQSKMEQGFDYIHNLMKRLNAYFTPKHR